MAFDPQQRMEQQDSVGSTRGVNGDGAKQQKPFFEPPTINLPKGGGAIQGIGEKFQANPVTGTGSMTVPIAMGPGRGGFTLQLSLSYDSGAGNSPFGLGWNIGVPSISRKTSKGLPQYDGLPNYQDANDSDVFLLSGAEDLIPVLNDQRERYARTVGAYTVERFRPRIEGLFARIERWTHADGMVHWKSISRENIVSVYGKSAAARVFDPERPERVFTWKLERTYDDRGNIIEYDYQRENGHGTEGLIYEKNRAAYAQHYLKSVRYGNTAPYQPLRDGFDLAAYEADNKWLFEVVFDYGEHEDREDGAPAYSPTRPWSLRQDPYSTYRAGFEVRTYRLCRRILMYHHMPEELGVENYLVKATVLTHREDAVVSQLTSVQHTGYQLSASLGAYTNKSYPAVTFDYTKVKVDHTVHTVTDDQLPNLPQGIDGQQYQFVDLYQEGLSGVLAQRNGGWYYKENLGGGAFGAQRLVASLPSPALSGSLQLADYEGNGRLDAVVQTSTLNGYYELDETDEWESYRPFAQPLSFPLNDSNARQLDLNGDGIADVLLTEDDCFVYHASAGKEGYKAARRIAKMLDEERGPRIVFNEAFQTIFLADMSGDGLTDLVRIRNGAICYWPNLGHGHFGTKVTMAGAPHFDTPDYYDPSLLRLVDIDGSGATDVLYIGRNEIHYWLNASGNSWMGQPAITSFPRTTQLHTVSAFDFLGNGCACLVWSSPLPAQAGAPLQYIQLMADDKGEAAKPYLLRKINNNMGAVTELTYAPSTEFYLADKAVGKPWVTKLPFVVQVLKEQQVFDLVTGNKFVTEYAYHHGYFDGVEREFRGFGMVEQRDTAPPPSTEDKATASNWNLEHYVPPVLTKTWFDNGYWQDGQSIIDHYAEEYYQGDDKAWDLPSATLLNTDLNAQENREAFRAMKGNPLRVEVYGLDGSDQEEHPFTVTETSYEVRAVQRQGTQRHGSFFALPTETLTYHYERNPADPRITHELAVEIDWYGQTTMALSIVYPRRQPATPTSYEVYPEQQKVWATYTEAMFLHLDYEDDFLRLDIPLRRTAYEIQDLQLPDNGPLIAAHFNPHSTSGRALISDTRITYFDAEVQQELPSSMAAYHGIPFGTKEAVLTLEQLQTTHGYGSAQAKLSDADLEAAGYERQQDVWYRRSGRVTYAADQFFLPVTQQDPLSGQTYHLAYDDYALAHISTYFDFLGHRIASAGALDYRTLQPWRLTDPNGNQQTVLFDALGMVVATAVSGKKNGEGDSLDGYQIPDLDNPEAIKAAALNDPHSLLQGATSFFFYDLHAWNRGAAAGAGQVVRAGSPNYALSIVRERHKDTNSPTQVSFSYADGFGQTILVKVPAEPGKINWVEDGQPVIIEPDRRWVGNGRTVLDNKGNPVKQYEPYFSPTPDYEAEAAFREQGVSPTLHYDALSRNVRTDLPDGTFTKVEFTPWEQRTYDQNDTVLDSDWYTLIKTSYEAQASGRVLDPNGSIPNVQADPANAPARAAWLAAKHYDTPKVEHLDALGRVFLLVDDDGTTEKVKTHFVLNLQGSQVEVWDALGRQITINHYDLLQQPLKTDSMDGGRRWLFHNMLGQPVKQWNDRGFVTRMTYDDLQRNLQTWVSDNGAAEQLVYLSVYGEQTTNPSNHNLFGQLYRLYDQAGLTTFPLFDFKGNGLEQFVTVAREYKETVDYAAGATFTQDADIQLALNDLLENRVYTTSTKYDALSRPVVQMAPDGSQTRYRYNEANLLDGMTLVHREASTAQTIVHNIDYDSKGQRTLIRYGNGVKTKYTYDPLTFRLQRLKTTREGDAPTVLQDLNYYYDPVGNITDLFDYAQDAVFYANAQIKPHGHYEYDALYRLEAAEGREQLAIAGAPRSPIPDHVYTDQQVSQGPDALRRYFRKYTYDKLGNILKVEHRGNNNGPSWKRLYKYEAMSRLATGPNNEPIRTENPDFEHSVGGTNNYLTQTKNGELLSSPVYNYTYDAHGNMISMPHLPQMNWDFVDQFKDVDLGGGGHEYYTYTMAGGKDFGVRRRKVTEKAGGKICDRIYVGDFEVYRERRGNTVALERESLHLQDDTGRILLIDTQTVGTSNGATVSYRYQLSNHLDSATLELDEEAKLISCEEYYPFGGSCYRSGRSAAEVKAKRYRYVGKERDENTGLDYYGARYYASWLCRFFSVDPLKDEYPFYTSYQYAGNKPVTFIDLDGLEETPPKSVSEALNSIDPISVFRFKKFIEENSSITQLPTYSHNSTSTSSSEEGFKLKYLNAEGSGSLNFSLKVGTADKKDQIFILNGQTGLNYEMKGYISYDQVNGLNSSTTGELSWKSKVATGFKVGEIEKYYEAEHKKVIRSSDKKNIGESTFSGSTTTEYKNIGIKLELKYDVKSQSLSFSFAGELNIKEKESMTLRFTDSSTVKNLAITNPLAFGILNAIDPRFVFTSKVEGKFEAGITITFDSDVANFYQDELKSLDGLILDTSEPHSPFPSNGISQPPLQKEYFFNENRR